MLNISKLDLGIHTLSKGVGRSALQILQSKGAAFFLHDFLGRTDLTFQSALGGDLADGAGEAVALGFSIDQFASDTLAEAIVGQTNNVANPDFTTNTANWSAGGSAALAAIWRETRLGNSALASARPASAPLLAAATSQASRAWRSSTLMPRATLTSNGCRRAVT